MSFLGFSIISAIFAFALVIFVHELGHYVVGRWCGIKARVFSIGFGPKIFSLVDRYDTEWRLCALPLGGYVKFLSSETFNADKRAFSGGEDRTGSLNTGLFEEATTFKRSLTVLAGPVSNILMAIIIFSLVSIMTGVVSDKPVVGKVVSRPNLENNFFVGDRILAIDGRPVDYFSEIFKISSNVAPSGKSRFTVKRGDETVDLLIPYIFQPIVLNVELFSPARRAGLEEGDVFLEVNGDRILSFEELRSVIVSSSGTPVDVRYWRDGEIYDTVIVPELRPTEMPNGDIKEVMRIGVRGGPAIYPSLSTPSLLQATSIGVSMTFYVLKSSITGLLRIIDNTISPKHLSGPIGVAQALSHTANEGLLPFLSLLAAISAGIGLINLFPIPILDGGHLVFFLYEAVFGKQPSETFQRYLLTLGLTFLLVVMVFATINDILRW
ncbi:MAG: RIP metalloprotease RseP [Pseudomonadota bacterium]|nr:RIP metalloprotease RseP [Pseudomonadota bacterium]